MVSGGGGGEVEVEEGVTEPKSRPRSAVMAWDELVLFSDVFGCLE